MQCCECKFFDKIEDHPVGKCRFNAPVVFPFGFYRNEEDKSLYIAKWALVFENDWCGQFSPIIEEQIPTTTIIDRIFKMFRGEA